MALPLGRTARERYRLDELAAGDLGASRRASLEIERRAGAREAGPPPSAGALHAAAVLYDLLVAELRHGLGPLLRSALARLEAELGADPLDAVLADLDREFGRSGTRSPDPGAPAPRFDRVSTLLALWLLNRNPALAVMRELFDDRPLGAGAGPVGYETVVRALLRLLDLEAAARPAIERPSQRLLSPAAVPTLEGQLRFIADRWTDLEPGARELALRAVDALAEERPRLPGPAPVEALAPPPPRAEPVRAAPESAPMEGAGAAEPTATPGTPPGPPLPARREPEWMTGLVLVAKHTAVWLDQLSRAHGRPISRLDQVPDEELARLAADGFTGLWLVGIWERSAASAEIKRRCGQPDAGASAYSIFDYRVARVLGGDDAAERLQERALAHGIRLAVDVVPNHVGIDSRWVREHPDWLLQVDRPPFPGYRFTGPDLSGDPALGIQLEDCYWDRSDAAVVFRLVERASGRERFVYHGNDGTSTPWNDTAQLDYTNPEVRAAMRDTIVGLARRFPVLRFDAAMTLARRHFQRLWFPAPGDGGAVPSRSEHGLSPGELARRMPEEPWREITRRLALEAPGTLLLAEAFWLMETYFVRELGMHRVYHSAFMHMLRGRDTARLADLVAGTLETGPDLLGRYANFLTTPDEAPAAEQLGRGDRYFGACAVLATFPGLPLFGHGQVEGLGEQYGMEFVRPLLAEEPDPALRERHRREIVPLLRLRSRLGAPASFALLELIDDRGACQRDVLAYCAGEGEAAVVVAFNNSPDPVRGFLRIRSPGGSVARSPTSLADLLGVGGAAEGALRFRELRQGDDLERPAAEVVSRGLEVRLDPWQAVVWSAFGPVR
jgi:hypothetical protein